jgi:hypothetical protein
MLETEASHATKEESTYLQYPLSRLQNNYN